MMDATVLKPEATRADVDALIAEARELGCGAVCVSPSMLPLRGLGGEDAQDAQDALGAQDRQSSQPAAGSAAQPTQAALRVATVAGFPSGKHHSLVKATEARFAVQQGAQEVDVVIDVGAARAGDANAVLSELITVREAVPRPAVLKVIVESAALDEAALRATVRACIQADVDYVKTSTGFHPAGGASVRAVEIMADELRAAGRLAQPGRPRAAGQMGIKASGGIRDWETAVAMIRAGATRLGVSAPRAILDGAPAAPSAGCSSSPSGPRSGR